MISALGRSRESYVSGGDLGIESRKEPGNQAKVHHLANMSIDPKWWVLWVQQRSHAENSQISQTE